MTMLPDDPTRQGEVEDLMQDAAQAATEAAQQREDEAHEAEAAILQKTIDNGKKSDGDVTGADDTFISPKDLDFLNSK